MSQRVRHVDLGGLSRSWLTSPSDSQVRSVRRRAPLASAYASEVRDALPPFLLALAFCAPAGARARQAHRRVQLRARGAGLQRPVPARHQRPLVRPLQTAEPHPRLARRRVQRRISRRCHRRRGFAHHRPGLRVRGFPTLVAFVGGAEHARHAGLTSIETLRKMVTGTGILPRCASAVGSASSTSPGAVTTEHAREVATRLHG